MSVFDDFIKIDENLNNSEHEIIQRWIITEKSCPA